MNEPQPTILTLNDKSYHVIKLLGKGKGGYSYLVTDQQKKFVLKQIHHEPCSYYQFGNKLESELNDYAKLNDLSIPMPRLLAVDREQERLLKEYVDGPTIYELVLMDSIKPSYFQQIQKICDVLYDNDLNIDYFPTNFVVSQDVLYYIDYECNQYMQQWDFEHWGIQYWSKTPEFLNYLNSQ